MSAATQNEMERLKREVENTKGSYKVLSEGYDRLRSERDAMKRQLDEALEREAALAAKVENAITVAHDSEHPDAAVFIFEDALCEEVGKILNQRDLIKQAEALEDVGEQYEIRGQGMQYTGLQIIKHVRALGNKYRQRADEL